MARRARPGRGKLINDAALRALVAVLLKKRRSPEQISRELRERFPDQPDWQLVSEAIYQAIYRPELGRLHRQAPTGAAHRPPTP